MEYEQVSFIMLHTSHKKPKRALHISSYTMKFISVVVAVLASFVAANGQEEEFVPQMHRRLVEVKSKNNASNRNRNLRGDHRGSSSLLDALDQMPVPKPVKTKSSK